MWWSVKARPHNARTVRQDWRTKLSDDKQSVYKHTCNAMQTSHDVFGIVLDEALELSRRDHKALAGEQARLSAELCERFVAPFCGMLSALESHARHFGTLPCVESLDPEHFRGSSSQQAARRNEVLSQVLWRQHNRFLHKLRTLHDIAYALAAAYRASATHIAEESSVSPKLEWAAMDCMHYDLTTCLSEGMILLKSFLIALPDEELRFFSEHLAKSISTVRLVSNRRAAAFRRQ
jgi:hypothetical protein